MARPDGFERAVVGLAEIDGDGRFRRVDDALSTLLGRARRELEGTLETKLTRSPGRPLPELSGTGAAIERSYVRSDGGVVHVLVACSPLTDAADRWFAQFLDLTEQRTRDVRFEQLVSSITEVFWLRDIATG